MSHSSSTINQGYDLVKKGDFKEALKLFEQGGHWLEAAKVAIRLKKNSKAIEYFTKAEAHSEIANLHLAEGDYLQAAEYFTKANAFREAALALEQQLAKKHNVNRTNVASVKSLAKDARQQIKDIVDNFLKAKDFDAAATWMHSLGDKIKAAEYFTKGKGQAKAASIYEEHNRHLDAALAWSKAGDWHRAGEAFKNAERYEEAGTAFESAGALEAAITCYRRAKKLNLAGELCLKHNRLEQAADLFIEGKHSFEAAQCYRKLGKTDQLLDAILKLPKRDNNYNKACLLLIDGCIKKSEISFQVDDYLKEFLLIPFTEKTLKLFYEFGRLYEKLDFYESAEQIYKKIQVIDSQFPDIQSRLDFVRLQITGSPMAVRKILEDDFGYKQTSERLAGYQSKNRPGQIPMPQQGAAADAEMLPVDEVEASAKFSQSINMPAASAGDATPVDLKPGNVLFGRYQILEILGTIGGTAVCRVLDQEMHDELALKVLDSKISQGAGQEQFKKEIKLARKINHPNLVTIYDYGKHGATHYITMESIAGLDLKTILAKQGRFSLEKGAEILQYVCNGLEAIHAQGIIHRDIRPQNIKIKDDGVVKILDFGVASYVDLTHSSNTTSEMEQPLSLIAYMSPEQIQGRPLDKRSDIYSLGVLMYEIFTEQVPFDAKEVKGLIYQQLHDQPTPPTKINPGIPAKLEQCILKCINKNRDERYSNCKDIIDVLYEVEALKRATGSAGPSERPKVINERYEIKSEIGRGGMGVVYRAHDKSLGRDVALKFLPHELGSSPQELELFLNEARSAARLSHTNIVTIHNVEKAGNEHFIVMEFIDGVDLRNLIDTMEKLPFKSIELICRQVCDALEYAHKRKVFHRDIKSANILWTNDKIVKITDFGLAKIVEGVLAASTRVQGSPAYMSPEQILGKAVDHRTDIYSLGVALYEMVTGVVPFSKGDIAYHQLHTEPTPVADFRPDTPENLRTIIAKCMKKNPDERFQTANEILNLLP